MARKNMKWLALGGAAMAAAGFAATPASAQYYPQRGGDVGEAIIGSIIRGVLGAGNYGNYPYGNYGYNQRYDRYGYGLSTNQMVDRCAAAVEQQLNRYASNDRYDRYNRRYDNRYSNRYDNRYQGQARVAGITEVKPTRYGLSVDGVAMSGRYATAYNRYDRRGYGYNQRPDVRFDCDIERNGRIRDLDIDRR